MKLLRLTTVPLSLQFLIKGQPRFMSAFFEVLCVSSGPKEELEKVSVYEQVKVKEIQMTRQITPVKDVMSLVKLMRLFRKEKPAIVHTHTPKAGILGMLAANLAGVPIRLHTVAGMPLMEASGIKRKVLDAVEKLTYAYATRIYPNSQGLYDFILQNNYARAEKVKVIANGSSNGIDTSHFNPEIYTQQQNQALRQQLGMQEKEFVFIFVGRLVGDKGINELVAAFKNLKFEIQNLKLLLVGPLESELDPLQPETLKEIESNPNIITTGFQEDVRPYFAIANALVFPSYREGFPNVVMQAGAMGLPSIVSDINGCNEIIEDGKNGIIVPAKAGTSPSNALQLDLQQAMLKLVQDPDQYQELKSNARDMITSRYEQQLVWEALLVEYKCLLKDKGKDLGLEPELDPEINSG
ncbi:glycosyltransferase family 4 protein [Psychroflexus sp. CAK8W]|uniref:Glycosyltransferase family 4 protein n=1 Tax=Psychroflexus longus TaxID=2873596 RepID=A0ABS7XI78_9FLAO|nr:glycosyltransferase family 4 protein [Psychroflexus longus]MBZ9777707.1 glycosyltransferase family 4 protein [Psychroflexus longus]